ncbi:MAG: tetratricopeptide repeat protein [Desulfobacteria bacterium]
MIPGKGVLVLAAALLAGCAGTIPARVERPTPNALPPAAPTAESWGIFREIPGKYRKLADAAEKAGDLRRALLYRKVVNGFAPDDADARERVERLKRKIRGEADRHYRAALALEERGEPERAFREFLAVLVLDPDNEAALRRVKNGKVRKNGKNGGAADDSRFWTVRPGDTLRKIAGEAYRDPDKEFLIPWFNRFPNGSTLTVGTELWLPDVDITSSTEKEKGSGYSHADREGGGVRNPAERKEVERKDTAVRKVREADLHYEAGMRHFLAEDLDGAIREWERALSLDPAHPKARRDIEKARRLKGKIESPK